MADPRPITWAGRWRTAIEDGGTERAARSVFTAGPGVHFEHVRMVFEGARGISPESSEDIVQRTEARRSCSPTRPSSPSSSERFYREQGYLAAEVDSPRTSSRAPARVVIGVREGRRFVGRRADGGWQHRGLHHRSLVVEAAVRAGEPFPPAIAERAAQPGPSALLEPGLQRRAGGDYGAAADRETGQVDVAFAITEGPQVGRGRHRYRGQDQHEHRSCASRWNCRARGAARRRASSGARGASSTTRAPSRWWIITRRGSGTAADVRRDGGHDAMQPRRAARDVTVKVPRCSRPDPLRRVLRHRARARRHLRPREAQFARQGARQWGLRSRYDAQLREARVLPEPAVAAVSARSRPPRSSSTARSAIPRPSHRCVQRRSLRHLDPAGDGSSATGTCGATAYRYERGADLRPARDPAAHEHGRRSRR